MAVVVTRIADDSDDHRMDGMSTKRYDSAAVSLQWETSSSLAQNFFMTHFFGHEVQPDLLIISKLIVRLQLLLPNRYQD